MRAAGQQIGAGGMTLSAVRSAGESRTPAAPRALLGLKCAGSN